MVFSISEPVREPPPGGPSAPSSPAVRIPLCRPDITPADIQEISRVLGSGQLGLGPRLAEFEARFAQLLDVRFAVPGPGSKSTVAVKSPASVPSVHAALAVPPLDVTLSPGTVPEVVDQVTGLGQP